MYGEAKSALGDNQLEVSGGGVFLASQACERLKDARTLGESCRDHRGRSSPRSSAKRASA
jgi:hypothetical protein